jgi:putative FmdB family regulatory protein
MPIYDYHCDHCGHTFSQVQSYTDATLETCPSCGKRPRKLMATPAIVFKGGGWYKTDSRTAPKESDGAPAVAKDASTEAAKGAPKEAPKEPKGADGAATKDTVAKAPAADAKSGSSKAEAASS